MQPAISIVIPVYNGAEWLQATLSSVLRQTYPHGLLDLIVVDDGSTDGSADLAAGFLKDAGISHRILRVDNGGPARARNLGWKASSADWIQFLDSDDLLSPRKLELHAKAAARVALEAGVIYSGWQTLELLAGSWAPAGTVREHFENSDVISGLLTDFLHTGACLFRRAALEQVGGFDERYRLIEDVDLLLRIAMANWQLRYCRQDEPVFYYRRHATESLSRRDPVAFHEGCIRNAAMVEAYWRGTAALTPERARLLAGICHYSLRFFATADRQRFEELVGHIQELSPGFVPERPAHLRKVSRWFGFRRAELLSVAYRRAKAQLGGR